MGDFERAAVSWVLFLATVLVGVHAYSVYMKIHENVRETLHRHWMDAARLAISMPTSIKSTSSQPEM